MRKILIVLSEWGFWGEELIGPLEIFDDKGYESSFCTPTGKRPRALPPSMDPTYIDPPLGKSVTSAEMAEKVRAIDNLSNQRLDGPISLSAWFPERPYWSGLTDDGKEPEGGPNNASASILRQWEEYYRKRDLVQKEATDAYDAVLLVGGSGPMIDMVNNYRLHDLILGFFDHGKPIAAECYGVPCLAQARQYEIRKSIIWGKHVTGHPIEYDYRNNTGVLSPGSGNVLQDRNGNFVNFGPPFYTLEYVLRDAVGPDGQFHGNVGKATSVIVDYPFITGRSTPDSYMTGRKLAEVLDNGLKRFGVVAALAGTIAMSKTTGRYAFLRQLVADGITCMFGNPGTSEQNLLDALSDVEFKEFRYYLALHEGAAVAIADGYARALKRPTVVQLHSYAGLANGLGMMFYARRGYTPLVIIAGEAGLRYDALDGQMAADLVTMARPFVKSDYNGPCAWRVLDRGSLLRLLRRAIKTAATPPTGPVFLALPMDVLDEESTEPIERSLPVRSAVTPDRASIAEAARLLAHAERPLILIGDGIAASDAQAELTLVAEKLGAAVWGANCSEVNMAASHPLFCGYGGHMFGESSRTYTAAADVVLVCGTTVLPEVFPLLENVFAKDALVIHFDLNSYEIAKNFPVTLGALADPKPTLALLARELDQAMTEEQHTRARGRSNVQAESKERTRQAERAKDAALRDQMPLRAPQFMEALAERLPKDVIVFDEALTHSPELLRYLPQDRPGSYFQTRVGMLGTGLPGAIGLKIAHPDRMVFGFAGDGGSMSTIQALATAARYNIGAKFVICNNRSYRILKYNLREYWRTLQQPTDQRFPDAFELDRPDLRFDKMAESLGIAAVRVERPGEIRPAIERAVKDPNEPFLIDLTLSNEL